MAKQENWSLHLSRLSLKKAEKQSWQILRLLFNTLYNAHNNVVSAKVSTAIPLDKELKEKIMAIVQKNSDGNVEIEEEVNKELLGGFVIKIGDQQVDSSIQSKLQKLNREFRDNLYVNEL